MLSQRAGWKDRGVSTTDGPGGPGGPDGPGGPAGPGGPVPVRPARTGDAPGIAAVQSRAWRLRYAHLLPEQLLDELTPDNLARAWDTAISTAPSPRHRVLVACQGEEVVGFASLAPSTDADLDPRTDADLLELAVAPDRCGQGHGSRLLTATAQTLAADGFAIVYHWVSAADDELRRFLSGAGWGPDAATRELDLYGDGHVRVRQVRLHTGLTDPGEGTSR